MSARDELVNVLDLALANECDTWAAWLGGAADELIKAGWHKQRVITDADELDALPVGSAVGDSAGFIYERYPDDDEEPKCNYWLTTGDRRPYSTRRISLPVTVICEPGDGS